MAMMNDEVLALCRALTEWRDAAAPVTDVVLALQSFIGDHPKDIEERLEEDGRELARRAARYIRIQRREVEWLRDEVKRLSAKLISEGQHP